MAAPSRYRQRFCFTIFSTHFLPLDFGGTKYRHRPQLALGQLGVLKSIHTLSTAQREYSVRRYLQQFLISFNCFRHLPFPVLASISRVCANAFNRLDAKMEINSNNCVAILSILLLAELRVYFAFGLRVFAQDSFHVGEWHVAFCLCPRRRGNTNGF